MSSLYLDHFGLNKPPFQITPDLVFFFAGGHRGDILSDSESAPDTTQLTDLQQQVDLLQRNIRRL